VTVTGVDRYIAGYRHVSSGILDIAPVGEGASGTLNNPFDTHVTRVTVQRCNHVCAIGITVFRYGRETFATMAHIKRDIKA